MSNERAQVGWGFWLWWMLASTVGWAAGWAIAGEVLVWLLRQPVTEEPSPLQEAV